MCDRVDAKLQEQMLAVQAEESRKTISHLAEQERLTAQHKAEVENSLQGDCSRVQVEHVRFCFQANLANWGPLALGWFRVKRADNLLQEVPVENLSRPEIGTAKGVLTLTEND